MQSLFPPLLVQEAQRQRFILPQSHHSDASADGTGYWWLPQRSRALLHLTRGDAAAVPCRANRGTPKETDMFRGLTQGQTN